MKAISLLQPWASLYAHGFKLIETRSWNTKHRGPLLIHASKSKKGRKVFEGFKTCGYLRGTIFQDMKFDDLPFGAIIGSTEIYHVISTNQVREGSGVHVEQFTWNFTEREVAFGDYSCNRFAWLSKNNLPHKQIIPEVKGQLSIWNFEILPYFRSRVEKDIQKEITRQKEADREYFKRIEAGEYGPVFAGLITKLKTNNTDGK